MYMPKCGSRQTGPCSRTQSKYGYGSPCMAGSVMKLAFSNSLMRLRAPSVGAYDRAMVLEIDVDRDACMGSGNCVFAAPGVFDLDDDSIARVVDPAASTEEA